MPIKVKRQKKRKMGWNDVSKLNSKCHQYIRQRSLYVHLLHFVGWFSGDIRIQSSRMNVTRFKIIIIFTFRSIGKTLFIKYYMHTHVKSTHSQQTIIIIVIAPRRSSLVFLHVIWNMIILKFMVSGKWINIIMPINRHHYHRHSPAEKKLHR